MKEPVLTENINPRAKRDILELKNRIAAFTSGGEPEEAFRRYRLTRGVYGQRQPGVQMVRIKLPHGRITTDQLIRIAHCSDKYATGNLHATTRQDIQLHFVKLVDTPALWAELEDAKITIKEACGNTVRNVTGSSKAGIDPDEPFDVTPYAQAIFEYFLRNPICQDMGRKFKITVSSSEKDDAYAFIHDVGLIPRVKTDENGKEIRGFKVVLGGGLGAQPFAAQLSHEFLEEQYAIPLIEAVIRVFDRYGERTKRHKARMKYLLNDIGLEGLLERVKEEWPALKNKEYWVQSVPLNIPSGEGNAAVEDPSDEEYTAWLKTNVFEQKQKGWYSAQVRVLLGDMSSDTARAFAAIVKQYAADDIRVAINQGYRLRYIKGSDLPAIYKALKSLGLADPGFDSTADITTCPGTDTCNLAISSSYGITRELEKMMKEKFPDLIYNNDIKIKISGCMNACGQHSAANIGFHGSSIKNGKLVLPAVQILLGGGYTGNGEGLLADKVIKVPTKRGPLALELLLTDYEENALEGEYFNDYYTRQTKNYFYQLLKPVADLSSVDDNEYRDWDHDELFKTEIGIGECASVVLDLVATTLVEAEEKASLAKENFEINNWADAIYHAYNTFITAAKGMLLSQGVNVNTQHGLAKDFDQHFGKDFYPVEGEEQNGFRIQLFSINQNEPSEEFATRYLAEALNFLEKTKEVRRRQLEENGEPLLQELVFGQDS